MMINADNSSIQFINIMFPYFHILFINYVIFYISKIYFYIICYIIIDSMNIILLNIYINV